MNTLILEKCLQELNKDKPDISYVKGILETFISLNASGTESYVEPRMTKPQVVSPKTDEENTIEDLYNRTPPGRLS